MNTKTISMVVAIVVIVGAASFYGGMKYGQSSTPTQTRAGQNRQFTGAPGMPGRGARVSAGFVTGSILSKDAASITVQSVDGGSKIVLLSPTTPVMRQVSGAISDLKVGEQITATGSANADGSITAQSLQIRAQGSQPIPGGTGGNRPPINQ